MLDLQNPSLSALSFALSCGLAGLGSACFASFARALSQRQAGSRSGRLLAGGIAVAMAWWSAALLARLAFPTPAPLLELEAALFSLLPSIGLATAALPLAASRVTIRRTFGAAGALTAVALSTPLAGALAGVSGSAWVRAPDGLGLAAALTFVLMVPALALQRRQPDTSRRRSAGAALLLAAGALLPQVLRLAQWPPAETVAPVAPGGPGWLGLAIALHSAAAIGLVLLIHRLVERDAAARDGELAGLRTANAGLAARVQALDEEKQALAERSLFDSGPVILLAFEADPPHRLRQASANLQEARGQPDQALPPGQPLDALLHPDDASGLAESARRAIVQPGAQREVRLARADGTWPWYLLHVVADRRNPATLLRAYLVDINRLKEAESNTAAHNEAMQGVVRRMAETQHFMETLQQLSELLQLCENDAESRQIITQGGPQLFPRWSGALTFADSEGLMTVAANWGEPFTAEHSEEADCWAVRRGRLHQNSAERAGQTLAPICGHFGGGPTLPPNIKHAICAPLLKSFDRPGVLHLIAHETMSEEELRTTIWGAETLADALKLSLANLRLRTSLREQAVRDVMTELYNRRYFDEVLNRELSRSQRTGDGLILAILDIDHFKIFNDTFGHEAGDRVLKTVAEQLQGFVRTYDTACRVGGEELAIIMPRAHIDEAFARLDRLREEIGACALTYNGVQLPAVTVSIGVSALDDGPPDDLLHRADTALYAAKNSGRNCVKRWEAALEEASSDAAERSEPSAGGATGPGDGTAKEASR